jgi:hypothetical protein
MTDEPNKPDGEEEPAAPAPGDDAEGGTAADGDGEDKPEPTS